MLDIGWSELLVIGVVALVVVGPKDLPRMLRLAGQMIGKVRRMASEFQGQVNEAIREAELDDVKKSVDELKSYNPANMIRNEIDQALAPVKQVGSDIDSEMARIEAGVHEPAGGSATAESLGLPEIVEPVPPALPEPTPFPEPAYMPGPAAMPEPVVASSGPAPAIEVAPIPAPPIPAEAEERSKSA